METLKDPRSLIAYVEETERLIRIALPVIPRKSYYRSWIMRRDTISADKWMRLAERLRNSPYVTSKA